MDYLYKWINNAKEMTRLTEKLPEAAKQPNYDAISLTLQSWLYQILTDAFGDVPMSEACSADEGILAPKFDTQQQVYRQIIDNLKTANELFDEANGLIYNQSGEMLYNTSKGDATGIKKWKKFCNSLRLRALLRVIDVPEFNAKQELRTMLTDPPPIRYSNRTMMLPCLPSAELIRRKLRSPGRRISLHTFRFPSSLSTC